MSDLQGNEVLVDFGYYEAEGDIVETNGYLVPFDLWLKYADARTAMRDAEQEIRQYPWRRKSLAYSPLIGY